MLLLLLNIRIGNGRNSRRRGVFVVIITVVVITGKLPSSMSQTRLTADWFLPQLVKLLFQELVTRRVVSSVVRHATITTTLDGTCLSICVRMARCFGDFRHRTILSVVN